VHPSSKVHHKDQVAYKKLKLETTWQFDMNSTASYKFIEGFDKRGHSSECIVHTSKGHQISCLDMLERVQKHEKYEVDLFVSGPGSHPNKKKHKTQDNHHKEILIIQIRAPNWKKH